MVERWLHICSEHSELTRSRAALLAIVPNPAYRIPGRRPHEEWFYGRGLGPTKFVKVVVHYEGQVDRIWTAFPRRRFP